MKLVLYAFRESLFARAAVVLLLLVAFIVTFSSCTTSSGSTYDRVVAAERRAIDRAQPTESEDEDTSSDDAADADEEDSEDSPDDRSEEDSGSDDSDSSSDDGEEDDGEDDDEDSYVVEEPSIGLLIDSAPAGADVFIKGRYVGQTPVFLEKFRAGTYDLRIAKNGYRTISAHIYHDGGNRTQFFALEELTGTVRVSIEPTDADVTLDGVPMFGRTATVPIGSHYIRATRFGYQPAVERVEVFEDRTSEVDLVLDTAEVAIADLEHSWSRINPSLSWSLGDFFGTFRISTYATGSIIVYNPAGEEVYHQSLGEFDSWEQSFEWHGVDHKGNVVPDGEYTVTIRAEALNDDGVDESSVVVNVDSSIVPRHRPVYSGHSGLALAHTPDILPAPLVELGVLGLMHVGLPIRVPVSIGLRAGIGERFEMSAALQSILYSDGALLPALISAGAKMPLVGTPGKDGVHISVAARATYQRVPVFDPFTNYPGVSLSLPVALRIGGFGLIIDPEIVTTLSEVRKSLLAFGYGRAGVLFESDDLIIGASASIRTDYLHNGLDLAQSAYFNGAAEVHFRLSDVPTYLTFLASIVWDSGGYFIQAGGGFSGIMNPNDLLDVSR